MEKNKLLFIHTPKTGGGSMENFFYNETKKVRRNYFLSFNGTDDSLHINDERSTQRKQGNKTVIEAICKREEIVEVYKSSPHFAEAKMLFGHTNMAFPALFLEYNFEVMMVLREPIERAISNIIQFSPETRDGRALFSRYDTEHKKYSAGYWDSIYEILIKEYPIPTITIHDNFYLRNLCPI